MHATRVSYTCVRAVSLSNMIFKRTGKWVVREYACDAVGGSSWVGGAGGGSTGGAGPGATVIAAELVEDVVGAEVAPNTSVTPPPEAIAMTARW